MDLYAAMVTTGPFLLLALLADLKAFGPGPGATTRRDRHWQRWADYGCVASLGVGFVAAVVALGFDLDTSQLRVLTGMPLTLAALLVGVAVFASIRAAYRDASAYEGEDVAESKTSSTGG